jgi:phosphomevalonate kinase
VIDIRSSAPGKIVLCGEYAVLAGATAIAVAVDRRARVIVQQGNAETRYVRILGDAEREIAFRLDAEGNIEWPAGERVTLLDSVCGTIGGLPHSVIGLTLDTREFFDCSSGLKYGFGSSAALMTALMQALGHVDGEMEVTVGQAFDTHKEWQGGKGSGVDIATSMLGGLLEFRSGDKALCRPLHWPAGLEWMVVWSGQPASTGEQIGKFDNTHVNDATTRRLLAQAEVAAQSWKAGDAARVLLELKSYTQALMQFSKVRQLGIFEAGHEQLCSMADDMGILYKPCGAGGGDVGAAFAMEVANLDRFASAVKDAGFHVMNVSRESRGASIENGKSGG